MCRLTWPHELCASWSRSTPPLRVEDLKVPPGNRLHPLEGDRRGQHSISVNDQWRICFRFEDGDAYEVEFCDYH